MTSKKTNKSAQRAAETASVTPFNIARFAGKDASFKSVESLMSNSKNQFEKITQDAQSAGREQIEALVKSSTIFTKGLEEVFKVVYSLAQESAEKNQDAVKSLFACKTINEFTEAQNKIAQKGFDDLMQTTTKLSELTIKLATESFEPINTQLTKAVKKASESMAA